MTVNARISSFLVELPNLYGSHHGYRHQLSICLFRFELFDEESFQTLQQALVNYIQSEYVLGPAEADATCMSSMRS